MKRKVFAAGFSYPSALRVASSVKLRARLGKSLTSSDQRASQRSSLHFNLSHMHDSQSFDTRQWGLRFHTNGNKNLIVMITFTACEVKVLPSDIPEKVLRNASSVLSIPGTLALFSCKVYP